MLLCLQYSKEEEARFLSHLDLMMAMERAFRRAGLPLAFSEGFNPHPRIAYASALAVGVTSEGEYLDLQLREELPPEVVLERVSKVLPRGLRVKAVVPVTKRKQSLMAVINLARYRVEVPIVQDYDQEIEKELLLQEVIDQEVIDRVIAQAIAFPVYLVQRQGKKGIREVNIRPGIRELTGQIRGRKLILEMAVQTGSSGNVKPEEVVKMVRARSPWQLGENLRIHRLGLYIYADTQVWLPLERS